MRKLGKLDYVFLITAFAAFGFIIALVTANRDESLINEYRIYESPTITATATHTPDAPPTLTPTTIIGTQISLAPEPTATLTPEPEIKAATLDSTVVPLPPVGTHVPDYFAACYTHPDRYDWKKYALLVGFPPEVVDSAEMLKIITTESHGDLCAMNSRSGAICWIQQYPGNPEFLDPYTCMSQGYAKYLDGMRNYPDKSPWWQHWYQWWGQ